MPASETMANVKVAANKGERWFSPASAPISSPSTCRITRHITVNAPSTVKR